MFQLRVSLVLALAGCTAPTAPHDDDLPCPLACETPAPVGTSPFATTELSGLAASAKVADLLWTHADSGNTPVVYALDTTAHDRGALHLTGATNVDWEDIAVAPCAAGTCIYVADIGDNDHVRTSIALYEVTEPLAAPGTTVDVPARKLSIAYPDGAHDAEALIVDPRDSRSYVLTKVPSGPAVLYELPRDPATTTTAVRLGELAIPSGDPRVTAADLYVDACEARLLVRTHDHLFALRGAPDTTVPELLAAAPVMLPVAVEPQGEAIAIARDGRAYFTISEGAAAPLYRAACP